MEATQTAQISGYDMMEYCREHGLKGSEDWQVAMYVRGILTQGELLAATSISSEAGVQDSIEIVKAATAEWLLS